ncbi:hypothetical protein ABB37_04728 [Leptomonas pyrrhocoris]|uniref:Uncharacterized protein n=1 Tax=Leptomonas pyrrhocoris TaxID=157538 RepID=A0A0M9G1Y5_LEPPY|nr:hypothetical protein ABB37_04728 [Leptomonas pyrrhocoris]KPA80516.1 hypothetical protein ABB37_04728 [Leptomonas pyrrhocoris]|eukprot:XP_015658955.1 hypothetical protein ABB37_04728 [Leptomonas pyrrhocoris]
MSGTPMNNEQRAALERRLAELRAAQAAATGRGAANPSRSAPTGGNPPAPTQQQWQQNAPQNNRQQYAPQTGYGYDDDDEEEEEDTFDLGRQQFEEEFLRMLAVQRQQQAQHQPQMPSHRQVSLYERNAASVTQVSATRHADEGVDVVATDKTSQRPHELGDFEVLRLAKMGDGSSMLDFGSASGVDWKTFVDNRGRNALHYAADAGAAALIRKLTNDLRVPYVADERQLTPLDVAVLNGHDNVETDEVVAALVAAATATRHADASLADPHVAKTLESVLHAHAPAPPKFVLSKPVPKPVEASGVRSFWSATATAPSSAATSLQCSSGADMSAEEAASVTAEVNALDRHGRLDWLLPVTRGSHAPCRHWQIVRHISSGDGPSGATATTAGIIVAQMLAHATLKGPAALRIKKVGDTPVKVTMAAHLGVLGTARRAGVAASLLHALRTRLCDEAAGAAANAIVFFASGTQLPRPPTSIATIKWYRRVFDAVSVYASDSAYDVFPDFYNYDAVLRADAVLKGAIPTSLFEEYAAEMPRWCDVDPASDDQCALVVNFMAAKAGTPESNVELACVPQDVAELRNSYLGHPDHHTYVRTDAQGAVTDLVVFRRRDARKGTGDKTFAAEVVFSLFTSIAGMAKVDHMMLLSSKLLEAKMLLVPTMFGITESDLAKSNFDEVVASREFVYGVSPSTLKDVDGLGAVPAAKLSLPLYCT